MPDLGRLGRYTVVGHLGQGGMGTVLAAVDHDLDRQVAIKVLRRSSALQTQRLLREAQAMARLSHPNVVQVYEVGEVEGQAFVAMELVEGQTVRKWMRQKPRPDWRACLEVFIQLGEGLAAAHAQGLVHRDFKPGNAIIDKEGRARVLDFGLARQADATDVDDEPVSAAELRSLSESSALSTSMTRTGAVMGTPAYMAPEQMVGGVVDAFSDQYSFCATLWQVLYGELPYAADSVDAQAILIMEGNIPQLPPDKAVPRRLHQLLLRGLSVRRADRWPSMDALLVELRRLVTPRSRLWWGAALGGVGLIAVAGAWAYQSYVEHRSELVQHAERCTGARAELADVWDESRKQAVRQAIEATSSPHATETWGLVEATLDAYAEQWVEAHTATCRATRVTQEQSEADMSLRVGCLRERRLALDEVVEVLVRADAGIVNKAATLAWSLPTLSRCEDVEALRAEQPPPEDPDAAEAVRALRERLAEGGALAQAGVYDEALALSEAVVAEAERLDYGPLQAESRLARGRIHKNRGDFAEAEADLLQAYSLGVEHAHPAVATGAASTLVFVVGYRLARYEAGLQWGRVARARARAPGSAPESEALALANVATVHKHRGELEPALDAYQRALAIFEAHRGSEHLTVARTLGNIGGVLYMQGKPDESLAYLQQAWPILEASLGPNHPELAIWLSNLGNALSERGRHEEALEHLQRALEIQEQASSTSVSMAITVYNIGDTWENQGRLDEALVHYRRALEIFEQELEAQHPQLAIPLGSVALLLLEKGELDEAQLHFQRALNIEEQAWGPEDARLTGSLLGLARVALARGDAETSSALAKRAISLLEADESDSITLASARFVLAQSLGAEGSQRAQARSLAEQARDAWAAAGPDYADQRAAAEGWLEGAG